MEMYPELNGIDYIGYFTDSDIPHVLDIVHNKNTTTANTGDIWYKDAYGNCLIALNNAKITDELFLMTAYNMKNIKLNKDLKQQFKSMATKIIT